MRFEDVYQDNYKQVLNFISFKTNPTDGEELTNDVFMKVYDNLHKFDSDKSKMSTWIFNIAKNVVIDFYRKRSLETTSIDSLVNEDGKSYFQASIGGTPLTEIVNSEYKEALKQCILNLPVTYKRMANLRYNCEFSYDEIADRMNISVGTVKGTLARARKMLKESMSNVHQNMILS